MRFGLQWFATDETLRPDDMARLAEDRGFESLFVTEHTHIPTSRRSPPPGGGSELPREYARTLDPFVALTAAALATSTLRVGTGILLVAQHHPLSTAKAVASLDLLSGGRTLFGVGAGWNIEELENHGLSAPKRFEVMREHVQAIRRVWMNDEAAYAGAHVAFEPVWSWPKPRQRPHPPVLVAGNGARVLDRVLAFGDEWAPGDEGPEALLPRLAELRRRCARAKRPPIPTTLFVPPADPATLARYEQAGVHRAVYPLPSHTDRDAMERELDRLAAIKDTYEHHAHTIQA